MDKLSPETYLKKPYSRILTPEEEGGFSAEILEFPGCFAEGETASEAYEALERAARSWVEAALEQGQEIPEPFNNQGYGGKVALRLPRSIHRQITKMAERDATSLNQFLVAAISMRVGAEDAYTRIAERLERHLTSTITHKEGVFAKQERTLGHSGTIAETVLNITKAKELGYVKD